MGLEPIADDQRGGELLRCPRLLQPGPECAGGRVEADVAICDRVVEDKIGTHLHLHGVGDAGEHHAPRIGPVSATLFGYEVDSDFPLELARPGVGERGHLKIAAGNEELLSQEGELVAWDDDSGRQLAVFTVAEGVLLWDALTGAYLINASAGVVRMMPRGPRAEWEHRLGAVIVPLLLAERGDLALHAATVVDQGRGIVVCGPQGRGKSTLAMAMAMEGLEVASEDGTVISAEDRGPVAWAGQVGVRVTSEALRGLGGSPSSDGGKTRLIVRSPRSPASVPVGAVVVLLERGGAELAMRRLDPPAAVPALMPSAIYAGPHRLAHALRLAGWLVERVPVFEARMPDDLSSVGDAAKDLLRAVGSRP